MGLQFYPTPQPLGERLANMIKEPQPPILEPSAGNGNLIHAAISSIKVRRLYYHTERDFHCIELDKTRAASLKGNDLQVIWDDFLTFGTLVLTAGDKL